MIRSAPLAVASPDSDVGDPWSYLCVKILQQALTDIALARARRYQDKYKALEQARAAKDAHRFLFQSNGLEILLKATNLNQKYDANKLRASVSQHPPESMPTHYAAHNRRHKPG